VQALVLLPQLLLPKVLPGIVPVELLLLADVIDDVVVVVDDADRLVASLVWSKMLLISGHSPICLSIDRLNGRNAPHKFIQIPTKFGGAGSGESDVLGGNDGDDGFVVADLVSLFTALSVGPPEAAALAAAAA